MTELAAAFQSLPGDYQAVLRLAQDQNRIAVTPLQALAGGWSGAMVYLVSVASQTSDRVEHYVLKLDRKNAKAQSDEIQRHETALRESPPTFTEQHLARMVYERIEVDSAMAIFYAIAGQSLHRYRTLSSYEKQNQLEKIFAQTYHYVLDEWNAARTFKQAVLPSVLLEQWLSFRLKPGSNIEKFLETICRVPPDIEGFLVQGSILPNPLAYARHAEWWGSARPIDATFGLQHGDLNTNNILIKLGKDDETLDGYYLIDFALFKEQMPLIFDLRYLEMSYLILRQSQVSFTKLVDLILRLGEMDSLDPQEVAIDVMGLAAVIGTMRRTFGEWVEQQYPSLHDDLWGQYWLAGVAAGLSYCHKPDIGQPQRLAGLLYAAVNLKRYSALFGVNAPTEARQLYDPAKLRHDTSIGLRAPTASRYLPTQVTTFVGRGAEAMAVEKLLTSDDVRLVTLTGPGGVGKTRLSLEVAMRVSDSFPDGVFFVPLADTTDATLVVPKIAQVLGVREGGSQPLIETVKGFLHQKRALLVLDNFEQLVTTAPLVAELLIATRQFKILVSSRIVLQLRAEHEVIVPPLETPNAAQAAELERLSQNQSVQLFVERAQASNPRFSLTPENAATVAEICRQLDGLPLAIELAAARIRVLTPQQLLSRLDDRLALLTSGARDLPLRHQTLRNSLDLSYDLLGEEEQILFSRLGVFVGGFTLEIAEAVCNAAGTLDVLDGVATLTNNSLLRSEEGQNGQPRFRMLETIREYALDQLEQRAELESLQAAHATYYFTMIATEIGFKLYSPDSLIWLDWLESEHANIGAALAWGLRVSADIVPMATALLSWYWYRRGYLSEGRTWSQRVLASPMAQGHTPGRGFALQASTMLATWQSDLIGAQFTAAECLQLSQHLEDPQLLSLSLLGNCIVYINKGDYELAQPLLKESLALFKAAGDVFFTATTLVHLANVALGLGKLTEARARLEEAYSLSRAWGEGWINSFVLNNLGEVSRVQGDYAAAQRYYEQSESLLREMGDKGDLARLIHSLGYVAQHEGDLLKAEAQFRESLSMFRVLGNRRGIAECLAAFAGLRAVQDRAPLAAQLLGTAEGIMAANGAGWWPADRGEIERSRNTIQAKLESETFAAELAKGQQMMWETAVVNALR